MRGGTRGIRSMSGSTRGMSSGTMRAIRGMRSMRGMRGMSSMREMSSKRGGRRRDVRGTRGIRIQELVIGV